LEPSFAAFQRVLHGRVEFLRIASSTPVHRLLRDQLDGVRQSAIQDTACGLAEKVAKVLFIARHQCLRSNGNGCRQNWGILCGELAAVRS
jgi:hypothetical protein